MADIELVIRIPEEEYDILKNFNAPMTWAEHLIAKGTPLPENSTNGDMIKAMFNPYQIFVHTYYVNVYLTEYDFNNGNCWQGFDVNWWNAPYKRGDADAESEET